MRRSNETLFQTGMSAGHVIICSLFFLAHLQDDCIEYNQKLMQLFILCRTDTGQHKNPADIGRIIQFLYLIILYR